MKTQGNSPIFDKSEPVEIKSNGLVGRVIDNTEMLDGEVKYTILLDDETATEDGLFCARESEIRGLKS